MVRARARNHNPMVSAQVYKVGNHGFKSRIGSSFSFSFIFFFHIFLSFFL